jgi:hypothetical protein
MNKGERTAASIDRMLEQHGLVVRRKAIEPDAFISPSHEARERHGISGSIGRVLTNQGFMRKIEIPKGNADSYLHSLGYTRNADTCDHNRKRMSVATMRFRCADCGKEF